MVFELVVMMAGVTARDGSETFPTLVKCRERAHVVVNEPSRFNPNQHLFMGPSGAKAYCRRIK